MNIKERIEDIGKVIGGIILILVVSLIISVGVKWILSFILIPLLTLLALLGINISFEPEVLESRISILAFIMSLAFILFGERLLKKNG